MRPCTSQRPRRDLTRPDLLELRCGVWGRGYVGMEVQGPKKRKDVFHALRQLSPVLGSGPGQGVAGGAQTVGPGQELSQVWVGERFQGIGKVEAVQSRHIVSDS